MINGHTFAELVFSSNSECSYHALQISSQQWSHTYAASIKTATVLSTELDPSFPGIYASGHRRPRKNWMSVFCQKTKWDYSFSFSCRPCELNKCFQISISRKAVKPYLQRSPRHLPSDTTSPYSLIFYRPAVQAFSSLSQPSLNSSFTICSKPLLASWHKSLFAVYKDFCPPYQLDSFLSGSFYAPTQLLSAYDDLRLAVEDGPLHAGTALSFLPLPFYTPCLFDASSLSLSESPISFRTKTQFFHRPFCQFREHHLQAVRVPHFVRRTFNKILSVSRASCPDKKRRLISQMF